MMEAHEDVVSAALALPAQARAELADRLLGSLEGGERAEIDAAWSVESERRIDQLEQGNAKLIPGDTVMAELASRCK